MYQYISKPKVKVSHKKKRGHPLPGFLYFYSDDPVLREDGLWRRGLTKKAFPDPHDPAGGYYYSGSTPTTGDVKKRWLVFRMTSPGTICCS